jgi:hypothetical protein
MGGAVSNVVESVGNIGQGAIDTVKDVAESDLGKAAILAAGAYYGAPYLMGEAGGASALDAATGFGANAAAGASPAVGGLSALDAASGFGANAAANASSAVGGSGTNFLGGAVDWAKANPLSAAGLGLTAAKALGGSTPSSSTTTNAIDPEMKAAYLRNLEEARATAAGLGERQFAAFPEYSTNMVQKYMNPYQQDVIDASMTDLDRQRQMQQMRDLNSATAAKAFGGSRQGVAQALTNEAYDRTAANTLANLRSQGFSQAQNLALQQEQQRQAYEQQRLDAARNLGLERLNISSSALGVPLSNLGGTQTSPIYKNTGASLLGGALGGGTLGKMIGGTANPEYAGYGALAGGLLGFL